MNQYYQAGYINPAATGNNQVMNETWQKTLTSGKWAFEIYPYYPGYELTQTSTYGYKFEVKPVQAGVISTVSSQGAMNAVSTTSKNPDRALMVLNLVNTDPYLRTLLAYGVEGVHYTKINNRVQLKANNGFLPWVAGEGNLNILPLKVGDPLLLYKEIFPKFNHAEALPILGYSFDQVPVKTQMASLSNLAAQYKTGLLTGASDPATVLPEFIQKLKAAGISDVVKEANNQVKAFLAAKK
jgi:putative aldouronate transport system substrate-binding protein